MRQALERIAKGIVTYLESGTPAPTFLPGGFAQDLARSALARTAPTSMQLQDLDSKLEKTR